MKFVIQRVSEASVVVNEDHVASIKKGLLALVGIEQGDQIESGQYLIDKIIKLRIFPDDEGRMNKSLLEVEGALLLVSQFTLLADTQKGTRPSFIRAGDPNESKNLFNQVVQYAETKNIPIQTGQFGADMKVQLINDGPVTFVLTHPKEK